MTDTKAERLADSLNDFISSSPDVEAAAVVSFDGLAMASALPDDMDEDRLGAMSAALLSLGEQAASGLGRGELSQVFVEGEHGFVFLMSAKDEAVLAAVTSRQAKIGFMLFEMRRAAEVIGALLEERARDPRYDAFEAPAAPVSPVLPVEATELSAPTSFGLPSEANGHVPPLSTQPWS
jgi:predicted regulator of Ras-like GTPase activity (Roadblock/LC7/MglB family)